MQLLCEACMKYLATTNIQPVQGGSATSAIGEADQNQLLAQDGFVDEEMEESTVLPDLASQSPWITCAPWV